MNERGWVVLANLIVMSWNNRQNASKKGCV